MSALLPCPFCGVAVAIHNGWLCHPNDDCLIGGSEWPDDPDIILAWEARAAVPERKGTTAGPPTDDEINDAVEEWHKTGTGALHDWLGWSFEEYAAWVRSPGKIPARPLPNTPTDAATLARSREE